MKVGLNPQFWGIHSRAEVGESIKAPFAGMLTVYIHVINLENKILRSKNVNVHPLSPIPPKGRPGTNLSCRY